MNLNRESNWKLLEKQKEKKKKIVLSHIFAHNTRISPELNFIQLSYKKINIILFD